MVYVVNGKRFEVFIICATAVMLWGASPALASEGSSSPIWDWSVDLAESAFNELVTKTAPTSTTSAITTGVLVVEILDDERRASLEPYLRENAVAVQQDISLGAGGAVEDLAVFYGVLPSEVAEFGGLLRDCRDELAPLIEPGEVDEASVRAFDRIVSQEIQS